MLCLPVPPVFAYQSEIFGDEDYRFGHVLRETAVTEFIIMTFVCFICSAEFGLTDLIFPPRLHALVEDDRISPNEGVLLLLPQAMKKKVLQRGIIRI